MTQNGSNQVNTLPWGHPAAEDDSDVDWEQLRRRALEREQAQSGAFEAHRGAVAQAEASDEEDDETAWLARYAQVAQAEQQGAFPAAMPQGYEAQQAAYGEQQAYAEQTAYYGEQQAYAEQQAAYYAEQQGYEQEQAAYYGEPEQGYEQQAYAEQQAAYYAEEAQAYDAHAQVASPASEAPASDPFAAQAPASDPFAPVPMAAVPPAPSFPGEPLAVQASPSLPPGNMRAANAPAPTWDDDVAQAAQRARPTWVAKALLAAAVVIAGVIGTYVVQQQREVEARLAEAERVRQEMMAAESARLAEEARRAEEERQKAEEQKRLAAAQAASSSTGGVASMLNAGLRTSPATAARPTGKAARKRIVKKAGAKRGRSSESGMDDGDRSNDPIYGL